MHITDESFEDALERRLHEVLDPLRVSIPSPPTGRMHRHRYVLTAALAAALLGVLGVGSVFASGSPNPAVWVKSAAHSLGVREQESKPPVKKTPAKDDSESPAKSSPATSPEHETENQAPGSSRPSPKASPEADAESASSPSGERLAQG